MAVPAHRGPRLLRRGPCGGAVRKSARVPRPQYRRTPRRCEQGRPELTMKILLLGANGQVGLELARSLAPLGDLHAATRDGARGGIAVDLANPETLDAALHAVSPDVVVNAAAYTAVDR